MAFVTISNCSEMSNQEQYSQDSTMYNTYSTFLQYLYQAVVVYHPERKLAHNCHHEKSLHMSLDLQEATIIQRLSSLTYNHSAMTWKY